MSDQKLTQADKEFQVSPEGAGRAQTRLIRFLEDSEKGARRRTGKGLSAERRNELKEAFNEGFNHGTGALPQFKKRSSPIGDTVKRTLK